MPQTDPAMNCTEPNFSEEGNNSGISAVSHPVSVAKDATETAIPARAKPTRQPATRPQLIYETGAGLFGFLGVMLGIETGYRLVSTQPILLHIVLLFACWGLVVVLWRTSRTFRSGTNGKR